MIHVVICCYSITVDIVSAAESLLQIERPDNHDTEPGEFISSLIMLVIGLTQWR